LAALDTGGAISQYGVMRHVTSRKSVALSACLLPLLIAFVAYRGSTFNYCVGYESRNSHFSVMGGDQVCGAGEESAAFHNLWVREGVVARVETIGQIIVHAFIP